MYIYFATLIIFSIIDGTWLYFMGAQYKIWLSTLFAPQFNLVPAILFYFLYSAGLLFFVINPSLRNHTSLISVFLAGAFLGLCAYGTYDLTNQSVLRDWPLIVTVIDIAWGAFATGVACSIVVSIFK